MGYTTIVCIWVSWNKKQKDAREGGLVLPSLNPFFLVPTCGSLKSKWITYAEAYGPTGRCCRSLTFVLRKEKIRWRTQRKIIHLSWSWVGVSAPKITFCMYLSIHRRVARPEIPLWGCQDRVESAGSATVNQSALGRTMCTCAHPLRQTLHFPPLWHSC